MSARMRAAELQRRGTIQPSFVVSRSAILLAILETLEEIRDRLPTPQPTTAKSSSSTPGDGE